MTRLAYFLLLGLLLAVTAWAADVEKIEAYRVDGEIFDTLDEAYGHKVFIDARGFVCKTWGIPISVAESWYAPEASIARFLADYPDETLQFLQSQQEMATTSAVTDMDIDKIMEAIESR